ncbi:Rv2175c family DNA-binding protein [Corynebacterium sphenisci]|uniref:Rv2175c family DNA-binding protein n=1 Tax=Corynebacterium sphenisci TaxID=191493 RepID=UPI0026DF612C|nr:Rv2175c family DNA-binding protein [Corynebacterium sphenisci]MDO5731248.1 Rv2175c family DNA-binding protein [Corynebacterium sphenisci]
MKKIPACADVLDPAEPTLDLPAVAGRLGVPVTRVHALLQEGSLVAVTREGAARVPAAFLDDAGVNRFVPGVLALLRDGGHSPEQMLRWLFAEDDSLPGRPVDALHGHLAREVRRRAQAMAL